MAVKWTHYHVRAYVEKLNLYRRNVPVKKFSFATAKTRDKLQRNIYNFSFRRQPRKPVGGFFSPYEISSTASRAIRRVS
jgi:hypothetical protein